MATHRLHQRTHTMTRTQAKATIDRLFTLLARSAESSSDNSRLLERAYRAALEGEKGHRRMGARFNARYRLPAPLAARYFVVKWYADPAKVESALDAVNLRDDCLYASALRLAMPECSGEATAILDIDYSEVFPA